VTGLVPLVLDLHIVRDRFDSSSDPNINGHLHYPNDVGTSLNEVTTDKFDSIVMTIMIPLTLSPLYLLLLVRLGDYIVN
jgi:hypothetical protein